MDSDRTELVHRPSKHFINFNSLALKITAGVLTAIVPAFITSYFSYKKAKLEASIGYATLVETVNHQGKSLESVQTYAAKLEGHIAAIEALMRAGQPTVITPIRAHVNRHTVSTTAIPSVVRTAPATQLLFPPRPEATAYKAKVLPSSLDKAIDAQMAK